MENVEIYDMTLKDFEEIKDVLISDFDDFWSKDILKTEILGDNKKYIVAKNKNQIIGFAGIMINIDEIEVMNIVVKKSFRGKGIGKILLNKIIEIAKEANKNIFLEVNENNFVARRLYENVGFEVISVRKKYYNGIDNAIIMKKN